ncbi:conserved hypothetical protein [delta proteobacterium NaphS2]|nr:conserved hypothetical protein [delta proteobacterium NaphS2]
MEIYGPRKLSWMRGLFLKENVKLKSVKQLPPFKGNSPEKSF